MNDYKIKPQNIDMFKHTADVLHKHMETVNKISKLQIAAEQLDSNIDKLLRLNSLIDNDNLGPGISKENRKDELIKVLSPVISIMQIVAYDKKKKKLAKRLNALTSEYLQNCKDIELANISRNIWTIANKYGLYSIAFIRKYESSFYVDKSKAINKLEKEYGLIPELIKNLEKTNISFIESWLLNEDAIKAKEKKELKIKKLDRQTESLVKNYIDKFLVLFENENSVFHKEYMQASENKKYRNRAEPKTLKETSPSNGVSKKDVTVKKENMRIKSKMPPRTRSVRKVEE